ncbi:MAG TPA: alpha/beta hydrolase [Candidatus Saccharimonadales bacterium]|nr:alpha/beta hydrolase [Candidatus Saccharimonadales bacterium]
MDDSVFDEDQGKVDFVEVPNNPGGEQNFSAKAQQDKFLAGPAKIPEDKPAPQNQQKEQWPMGERKSIEVNGRTWEYLEYGNPNGTPILNVHGWLGSSAEGNARLARALSGEVQESQGLKNLEKPHVENSQNSQPHGGAPKGAEKVRKLTESLKGKYNVIVPELPGFGKTPELDTPTVDKMAEELADFYKALGKKPAVAFGSSAGAILVTKMAVQHPELVDTLVLQGLMTKPSDMEKVPYWAARVVTFKPIAKVLETFPNFSTEKLFPMMVSGGKDFKNADEATQRLILDSAKEGHIPTMLDTLRDIGKNIEDEVAQVQAPTVIIDGANGDLVPIAKSKSNAGKFHPEAGESLGEKIRQRKVVYFRVGDAAGEHTHNVINTAPEEVAVLINHAAEYFKPKPQAK